MLVYAQAGPDDRFSGSVPNFRSGTPLSSYRTKVSSTAATMLAGGCSVGEYVVDLVWLASRGCVAFMGP